MATSKYNFKKRTAKAHYQKPDVQIHEANLKLIKALLADGFIALNFLCK